MCLVYSEDHCTYLADAQGWVNKSRLKGKVFGGRKASSSRLSAHRRLSLPAKLMQSWVAHIFFRQNNFCISKKIWQIFLTICLVIYIKHKPSIFLKSWELFHFVMSQKVRFEIQIPTEFWSFCSFFPPFKFPRQEEETYIHTPTWT